MRQRVLSLSSPGGTTRARMGQGGPCRDIAPNGRPWATPARLFRTRPFPRSFGAPVFRVRLRAGARGAACPHGATIPMAAGRGRPAHLSGARMDFTADHYFRASVERMSQAQHRHREGEGSYALAMYAAGLAVECLLMTSSSC